MNAREMAASLETNGYTEVTELGNLTVGARVRHISERYAAAQDRGTGTIERIFHKPDSAWSKDWGSPDIEVIVRRDEPRSGLGGTWTHTQLANYHLVVVHPEPACQ
ncbi:hypothetical protein LG293_15830 (plasmid) [Citricoccus nitrophenolicus]